MLNYSWDGEKGVSIPEAMKTMFASHLTTGANTWDARGHVMSGSNDMAIRTEVFGWIAKHEHTFYDARTPISPVGVYFSPVTRNYWPDKYVPKFRAAMELLLLSHREFRILTPRTISSFRGPLVIVPGKSLLQSGERAKVEALKLQTLDLDSELARFDSWLEQSFTANAETGAHATEMQKEIAGFSQPIAADSRLTIHASPFVICQIARVNGRTHVFLMNLKGIQAKRKLLPDAETGTRIEIAMPRKARAFVLPFLGDVSEASTSYSNGKLQVRVPRFQRSVVVWFEDNAPN
jgi:hypothetical protein